MRWFLVSAPLVVLGTIILVSFASEAQAETWSCSFLTVKKDPATMVFSRTDAMHFKSPEDNKWKVVVEDDVAIHLYKEWPKSPLMETAALYQPMTAYMDKPRFSWNVH